MAGFDFNLLRPLAVLLEEQSVTRAAERLHLSQPATSATLARLRKHYDDDLLVRSGRTMQLTPFARDLLPAVTNAMAQLTPVIEHKESFDPLRTERRFVISSTDYMTAILAGPLLATFAREAPGASLDFAPQHEGDGSLAPFATNDVIVGPIGFGLPGQRQELFTDDFVVIADPANTVLATERPTIRHLQSLPHAVAYLRDPEHDHLARVGVDHVVGARLFGLASLPLLVSETNMVALVPRMLAAKASRTLHLSIFELPPSMAVPMTECVFWHPRDADDPAMTWLRGALERTVPRLSREPSGPPPRQLELDDA